MKKFYLKAKVKNSELVIVHPERVRDFFAGYEGKTFEITVRELQTNVTAGWIRWYWGVAINKIIQEVEKQDGTIVTPEEVHAYNVSVIAKPKIVTKEIMGKTVVQQTQFSLKDLPMKKWLWFKENLQMFYADRGIDIPDPHEDNYMNDERRIDSLAGFRKDSPAD